MHMPTPKEGAKMRLLCIFDKPYIYTYALGIFSTGEKSSFSRRPIFNSFRKRQLLPIFVYITFFCKISVFCNIHKKCNKNSRFVSETLNPLRKWYQTKCKNGYIWYLNKDIFLQYIFSKKSWSRKLLQKRAFGALYYIAIWRKIPMYVASSFSRQKYISAKLYMP